MARESYPQISLGLSVRTERLPAQWHGLPSWHSSKLNIEGLTIGEVRVGAGESTGDLMELALQQVSALYAPANPLELSSLDSPDLEAPVSGERFIAEVRKRVVATRPSHKVRFAVAYRPSQAARVIRFGYVGSVVAANFASLNARRLQTVTAQVDRAKARLWDLHQLSSGVLADAPLGLPSQLRYELLVHRPLGGRSVSSGDLPVNLRRAIGEAEEELEAEADKFDIRFLPMRSPELIAQHLLQAEAA
jgi:hypothetical protein